MKKLMTILTLALSFAMLSPTPVEARDRRHHHSSHSHSSSHRHHTSRNHHHHSSSHRHHYRTSGRHHHHYYNPYYYGGYRERVLIGYDRYGYPIYSYRTPYRSSGFSLNFGF